MNADDLQLLEGDLQETSLPHVLKILGLQQGTGILTIQGEEDIIAVSCLKGHIVTADALNQTQEESLGKIVVSQKLMSEDELAALLRDHQASGESNLGDLLVSRGHLKREKLLEVLRFQTLRMMLQVMTWNRGEYKFYSGDEVSYEKGITPISMEEMLIRALSELGEKSGLPGKVPKLETIFRSVPARGKVQVVGRDGDGAGEGIWLTALEESFLQRFDGRESGLMIAKSLGTGRYKTLFSIYQLLQKDLIEPVGEASHAAGAPAARPGTRPGAGRPSPAPSAGVRPAGAPSPGAPRPGGARPASSPGALSPGAAARAPAAKAPHRRPPAKAPKSAEASRKVARTAPRLSRTWTGPALAAFLVMLFAVTAFSRPVSFLLPFSWQESQRATVERQLRQSLYRKIDRAAGAFFLMESHYPATLEELIEMGLLSPADTHDPAGGELRYSKQDMSYQIDLISGNETIEGFGTTGSVTGDFLLDQDYLDVEEIANPLVLLD